MLNSSALSALYPRILVLKFALIPAFGKALPRNAFALTSPRARATPRRTRLIFGRTNDKHEPLSIYRAAAVAMALSIAAPVAAQEAEAAGSEAAESEQLFDLGEPVDENGNPIAPEPQEPQPGQQYIQEAFNDWALRCLKVAEGEDPCQMYQLMQDDQANDVAEIAIVPLEGSGQAVAGATIVVPLETLLTEQITLRVDGGQARRFPFNFCNVGGCVTRLGLTADDIALFRRGATATLTLVPAAAPDQQVTVTMSLSGFTAAYNAVVAQ